MDTNDDLFGGFTAFASSLGAGTKGMDVPNVDSDQGDDGWSDGIIVDTDDSTSIPEGDEPTEGSTDEGVESTEETTEETVEAETEDSTKEDEQADSTDTEVVGLTQEDEPEVVAFFQEKLFEKLGWDLGDDEKFDSVENLVDYITKIVAENSEPTFANDEIASLNEFVANGGKIEEYVSAKEVGVDLENPQLSSESYQLKAVKEHLKILGYSDERIARRIERLQDTGSLKDEAEDAIDFLASHREKETKKLLEEQQKKQQAETQRNKKFIEDVQTSIQTLDNIRGVSIAPQEKKQLMDYIFKVDRDGQTKYQKDYAANYQKNLLESAYFTMKGDTLINKVEKKAASTAAANLKKKLEQKTKRGKDTSTVANNSNGDYSMFENFSAQLSKPKY